MKTKLTGAVQQISQHDGGSMLGGHAYLTWHTFEADPKHLSAHEGAKRLVADGNEVHFCLNPLSGELVQILPANRAGRGLRNPPGGVETNRAGTVHLQVEVIAFASHPFTSFMTPAGKAAIHKVSALARLLGVPDVFPAGQPLAAFNSPHHRIGPGPSGHYGHSQWRENDHFDPGQISMAAMFAPVNGAVVKGHQTHTVVKGDTVFSLAHSFHTTVTALAAANHISLPKALIKVGQVLVIP